MVKLVKNTEIAKVFKDIDELLKLKKDNIFKTRAYQKAARSIEELSMEVTELMSGGRLREISEVGEAIIKKITELMTTGHLACYEKLKVEFLARVNSVLG
ncbi:MAG: hypothetical protein CL874_03705 [Dehalococcoidales bacterium]|nr:hypothetical protein [Dehalococcoidales bacterium]MDP6448869.1 hypothetical protein [Dehalococcoidales bacterium]